MAMTPRQIMARLAVSEHIRKSHLSDMCAVIRIAMHGDKKDYEALIEELIR